MALAVQPLPCTTSLHEAIKACEAWQSLRPGGYQPALRGERLELKHCDACGSTLAKPVRNEHIARLRLDRPGTANRTMRRRLPGYAAVLTAQVGPWRAETRAQRHWRSGMGAVRERGGM